MGQSTKMSNTGLQQQGSAANGAANGASPAMGPSVTGSATVGNPTQGGPKKARSGYNAKAMERIRDSLRPFEDNNPTHIGHLNMGNLVGMGRSDYINVNFSIIFCYVFNSLENL